MLIYPGDILKTTCNEVRIPCWHRAIVIFEEGKYWVYQNTPTMKNGYGGNIVRQCLDEFLSDREILEVTSANIDPQTVREYSWKRRYEKWETFLFNCEDYVNDILTGQKFSQLRRKYVAVGLLGIGTYYLLKNKKSKPN